MKQETKLGALIMAVEEIAKRDFDGHYSLFSFTTNYKGCFGTPMNIDGCNLDLPPDGPRGRRVVMQDDIQNLPSHDSLEELLYYMAERPRDYLVPHEKMEVGQ